MSVVSGLVELTSSLCIQDCFEWSKQKNPLRSKQFLPDFNATSNSACWLSSHTTDSIRDKRSLPIINTSSVEHISQSRGFMRTWHCSTPCSRTDSSASIADWYCEGAEGPGLEVHWMHGLQLSPTNFQLSVHSWMPHCTGLPTGMCPKRSGQALPHTSALTLSLPRMWQKWFLAQDAGSRWPRDSGTPACFAMRTVDLS